MLKIPVVELAGSAVFGLFFGNRKNFEERVELIINLNTTLFFFFVDT